MALPSSGLFGDLTITPRGVFITFVNDISFASHVTEQIDFDTIDIELPSGALIPLTQLIESVDKYMIK